MERGPIPSLVAAGAGDGLHLPPPMGPEGLRSAPAIALSVQANQDGDRARFQTPRTRCVHRRWRWPLRTARRPIERRSRSRVHVSIRLAWPSSTRRRAPPQASVERPRRLFSPRRRCVHAVHRQRAGIAGASRERPRRCRMKVARPPRATSMLVFAATIAALLAWVRVSDSARQRQRLSAPRFRSRPRRIRGRVGIQRRNGIHIERGLGVERG